MAKELAEFKEFKKHVRLRPAMYLGNDSVIGLINGLLIDCLKLCKTDEIKFEIALLAENKFSIKISSKWDLRPFFNSFKTKKKDLTNYFPKVLRAISKDLAITESNGNSNIITFSLDENIIKDTVVDYLRINDEFLQIALLNRNTKIISIDKRKKSVNRICYHFPEGVLYLFERAVSQALGKPKFKVVFDGELNSRKYQIGLAYRTDWFPEPGIASFANEIVTVSGGSLVDGIIDGLGIACRKFAKDTNLETIRIQRKKFMNGLILVCAVNGDDMFFGGSFKEVLENDIVKKEAKNISERLALDFFRTNVDLAKEFLSRFDTTNPIGGMY